MTVKLVSLTRMNWENCISLEVSDDQQAYIHSNIYAIAASKFEECTPYGILAGEKFVGMLIICRFGKVGWVNHIMVDRRHQKLGYGRRALTLAVELLRTHPLCEEIRTSVSVHNAVGITFFTSGQFKPLGEAVQEELVLKWNGDIK